MPKSLLVPTVAELIVYSWQGMFTHAEIENNEVRSMLNNTCIDSRFCKNTSELPTTFYDAIKFIYFSEA